MTNIQKFAAQQLTKNQMNEVKGGARCTAYDKAGNKIGSGSYPGEHVAGATVRMSVEVVRAGWAQGTFTVSCA